MDNPLLALLLPSLLIVPAMGLLSAIKSTSGCGAEVRRKTLHIGTGLVALTLPYLLTEPWMVCGATLPVIAWMLAVRLHPALNARFGCVLDGAGRQSWGELYFVAAIAGLLLVSGDNTPLYAIPLLILTLADAAAAIVGRRWPIGNLPAPAAGKTVAGFSAFSATAFLITAVSLAQWTGMEVTQIAVVAIVVTIFSAVVEAVSARGLDNIAVPAVAWFILNATIGGV